MAVCESKQGLLCRHPPASIARMMIWAAIIILINANCGGAAVIMKSNATHGCISGREEECLIAEDMELELLLMEYSSHVARVLKTADPKHPTEGANKGTNVPCDNGKGKGYKCDTKKEEKKNGNCVPPNKFQRGCHH